MFKNVCYTIFFGCCAIGVVHGMAQHVELVHKQTIRNHFIYCQYVNSGKDKKLSNVFILKDNKISGFKEYPYLYTSEPKHFILTEQNELLAIYVNFDYIYIHNLNQDKQYTAEYNNTAHYSKLGCASKYIISPMGDILVTLTSSTSNYFRDTIALHHIKEEKVYTHTTSLSGMQDIALRNNGKTLIAYQVCTCNYVTGSARDCGCVLLWTIDIAQDKVTKSHFRGYDNEQVALKLFK